MFQHKEIDSLDKEICKGPRHIEAGPELVSYIPRHTLTLVVSILLDQGYSPSLLRASD